MKLKHQRVRFGKVVFVKQVVVNEGLKDCKFFKMEFEFFVVIVTFFSIVSVILYFKITVIKINNKFY